MNNTIVKAIEILEYASNHPNGFKAAQITKELNIPKSTTYNIINTLNRLKLLDTSTNALLILGSKTYEIGMKFLNTPNSLERIFYEVTSELGNKLKSTVFIGKLVDNEVLYVHKYTPEGSILNPCDVNTKAGVYYTALGKVLVAYTDNFDYSSINFEKKTPKTILNLEDFKQEISITKNRGYAIDDEESRESMICVSAPIFDSTGKIIYALSFSTLLSSQIDIESKARDVVEAANKISRSFGYLPIK